ncbi:MAG: transposase, partial [Polyangiales bacterium]
FRACDSTGPSPIASAVHVPASPRLDPIPANGTAAVWVGIDGRGRWAARWHVRPVGVDAEVLVDDLPTVAAAPRVVAERIRVMDRPSAPRRFRRRNKGSEDIGPSRGGLTTKLHAVVNGTRNPIAFALREGQRHEMTVAPVLLADTRHAIVIGDTGYDADPLVEDLRRRRCRVVIPTGSDRRTQRRTNNAIYRERHRVECFFQRLERS